MLNLASFSLPHCETFGLCATVISSAILKLALSPEPEGKTVLACLARGGRLLLLYSFNQNKTTSYQDDPTMLVDRVVFGLLIQILHLL